ncbi:hypothetical protein OAF62_03035 [Akkermansiaceae bacterium]|nr:hypothetical protein [Akkermansiaceae bacterium]
MSEKKIDRGLCLLRLQVLVEVVGSSRSWVVAAGLQVRGLRGLFSYFF